MMSFVISFFSGFALSASLIVAIGAQNLFVLRQGLKKEHVGPVVLFCGFSDAVLIIVGVSGMGALLGALPQVAKGFTLAGAGFLFWYGVKTLRQVTQSESMTVTHSASVSLPKAVVSVAAFTWLNPHVYLDTVLLMGTASTAQPFPLRPFFCSRSGICQFSMVWSVRLWRTSFAATVCQAKIMEDSGSCDRVRDAFSRSPFVKTSPLEFLKTQDYFNALDCSYCCRWLRGHLGLCHEAVRRIFEVLAFHDHACRNAN